LRHEALGPVRLVDGNTSREVNSEKTENLLTSLLVSNGRSLTTDQLIQEMWGKRPPSQSRAGLHVYVSQLRKLLSDFDCTSVIETVTQGYRLVLGTDQFDYFEVAQSARAARAALVERDIEHAARLSDAGLGVWRGTMRDAETGPIMEGFHAAAEELRLELSEINMSARLIMGGDQRLLDSLYVLVAEHPLREGFHSYLMLALHSRGRQAEALVAYQRVCQLLDQELGVPPGPELRRTHAAILAAEGDDIQPPVLHELCEGKAIV